MHLCRKSRNLRDKSHVKLDSQRGEHMKKIIVILLVSLVFLSFSGCEADSYSQLLSVENGTKTSWSQSHYLLDGTKSHVMSLGDKQQDMEIEVVTENGKIDIRITDEAEEEILLIENAETGTYDFSAEGKVIIRIFCDGHRGKIIVDKEES